MPYVTSVNGLNSARMESLEVAEGVLVPRVVYMDSGDIRMTNGHVIYQDLCQIAQMTPLKIDGTEDDYQLIMRSYL